MNQKTTELTHKLARLGIAFKVRNDGKLIKIRTVNYFPATGTVQIDGAAAFTQKGWHFLLEVLQDEGWYKPK